ncbi:uncharacterized protein B0H64DRAFT_408659 [Chaetomium fimeti]|uniref:Uncharacterized protein n=1 Tax=Chaetomium fimeti TaxID=1854472 RepID=A0AAE0H8N9_9PEZI|nr:hypothetical protein B0H64DRAFT_408659 [Chaetomium fimeti]
MRLTRIPKPFHPARFYASHRPLVQFGSRIRPPRPQESARRRFHHQFPKMSTTTTTTTPAPPTPAQLLEPLANPSAGAATADAVQAAVQGFSDQLRANQASIGDFVWAAYGAVFDAVDRTPPERQDRLVEFVARLRETAVNGADGKPLVHEGGELWTDLPTFGWVVRDKWNFDPSDPAATAQQRASWENLTAFVAQLTARSEGPDDPLDFSMFGLWAMREAFEDDNGVGSDAAVRLAALWVRIAGARLRKLSADGHELSARLGVPQGKYADRGWKGFNEERWKAWGDELKVAQASLGSDPTVQGAAKAMEEL